MTDGQIRAENPGCLFPTCMCKSVCIVAEGGMPWTGHPLTSPMKASHTAAPAVKMVSIPAAEYEELLEEVRDTLPLNGYGKCFWCDSCGNVANVDLIHSTDDEGDVKCLAHPDHARARRLLKLD